MRLPILIAVPLALAACSQNSVDKGPEDSAATEAAVADPAPVPPVASATPAPTATPSDPAGMPEGGIPVALQGSWGLVPADCTSTRGDAKGLLKVSATTLTYYESVARLGTIKARSDTSLKADFAYSGEGMTWSREETLTASGNTLTRTQKGGDEPGSGGPFTYTRCT